MMEKSRKGISFTPDAMHIIDSRKKSNETRSDCVIRLMKYAHDNMDANNAINSVDASLLRKLVKLLDDHGDICRQGLAITGLDNPEAVRLKELKK